MMTKRIVTKDPMDANIHLVMQNMQPVGWVEQFSPGEFKGYRADGSFVNWFTTKAAAVRAL